LQTYAACHAKLLQSSPSDAFGEDICAYVKALSYRHKYPPRSVPP
jgi:hypothetical protein